MCIKMINLKAYYGTYFNSYNVLFMYSRVCIFSVSKLKQIPTINLYFTPDRDH